MYSLISINSNGSGAIHKAGTLVSLAREAAHIAQRMGFTIRIYRPDGTCLNERAARLPIPVKPVFRVEHY